LGQALGVDYVATGRVVGLGFSPSAGRARATLAVVLTDPASGDYANGALADGFARSSAAQSGTAPSDEAAQPTLLHALQNAAFLAAETMNRYELPRATVLTIGGGTVRLNRGSRDGIRPGQEMVVLRGDQRVGRVRVTAVGSFDSYALITDLRRGIRPEDRARAVFALPELIGRGG
jgi:hypothetical protein